MDIKTEFIQKIQMPGAETLPGLTLRSFRGEEDYPNLYKIVHGCKAADGIERADTLQDIANRYAHLVNCDPDQDMLIAEVNGEIVGYTRVWWLLDGSGKWLGFQTGNVLPEWRRKGIGTMLLDFNDRRFEQVARQLIDSQQIAADTELWLDNYIEESEHDRRQIFERRGYQPVRFSYEMVRPDLENIPDLPLPEGVEVRPVGREHMRQLWEAENEAFKDHWSYIPAPWEEIEIIMAGAGFDPGLYRVAWHDDQMVGMVLNYIEHEQNKIYGRKRGYTEDICVIKPWRKQGIAKALIARSLAALKEAGMTEAALGVDTQNTSGALNLYKSMGYRVVKSGAVYRKQISV